MTYVRTFPYSDGPRFSHEIERVLRDVGIAILPRTALERVVYQSFQVVYTAADPDSLGADDDIRHAFGDMVSAVEVGLQLLRASTHKDFRLLGPHLELLNKGEVASHRGSRVTDQDANKIFELLTACYAMQVASDVEVDHPQHSRGNNPDIIMVRPEGRVAVACKVLHSKNPQTLLDRVDDGIAQIEASPAATGFVFINLRNVLDYDRFWPVTGRDENGRLHFGAFDDFESAERLMLHELETVRTSLLSHTGGPEPIQDLFRGRRAQPIILFYAHAMCGVTVRGRPVAVSIKYPYAIRVGDVSAEVTATIKAVSQVMQAVPEATA